MHPSRKSSPQVLTATYEAVIRLGSATQAAEELGISRQAVEQRMREGNKRGLFRWQSPQQRIDCDRLTQIIRGSASIHQAAEKADVVPATLRSLAQRFGVTAELATLKERQRASRVEERKNELLEGYVAVRTKIRREPTSYDLQRNDRAVDSGIRRLYGSIANFRTSHGIIKPEAHRVAESRRRLPRVSVDTRRVYVLERYPALVREIGHHPSTSEMTDPKHPERGHLYRLICKEWRTVRAFRRDQGIPRSAVGLRAQANPSGGWREVPHRYFTRDGIDGIYEGSDCGSSLAATDPRPVGNSGSAEQLHRFNRQRRSRIIEQRLVEQFIARMNSLGYSGQPIRTAHRGRVDIYFENLNAIVEAKGTVRRTGFRMAIGQLADYKRDFNDPICAILLPADPGEDLRDLARAECRYVIWPRDGGGYEGLDHFLISCVRER